MKKNLYLFVGIILSTVSFAQTKVAWGDEFKLHKGSSDLAIINADKSGAYFEESHFVRKVGWFGSTERKSSILVKLNSSLSEVYRKDFDKELKDKDLETFYFIQDKLYLFASEYVKKDKTLYLYAAELDKASGNLKSDWQQVYSWDKSEKNSEVQFRVTPNSDSSKIVVTSTYTGKTENHYEIKTMDANLKVVDKPFTISNEFDPKTFQVEDFVYTRAGNAILVGRVYEYEEGKKKKDKNLLFKNYNIRIYDNQGKMKKELVTDIDGKFLVSGKLVQLKNEIVLAAFYSNDRKKKQINGMLVQRMDPATGNVISSTKKDLNNSLITEVEEDDDAKSSKKKEEEEEEGLSANLVFRNFYVAPDNGLVILAEQYKSRIVQYSSTNGTGFGATTSTDIYREYECGDMYMGKITPQGNISWLYVLPKNQIERCRIGGGMGPAVGFSMTGFFDADMNRPFFSGFGCLAGGSTLNIFFNDNEKNADVLQPGKKIKRVSLDFRKTDCYQVSLDMTTGKFSRKILFSNKDIPTATPRLGIVLNKTMYLTGINDTRWGGKAKIAVGTITSAM